MKGALGFAIALCVLNAGLVTLYLPFIRSASDMFKCVPTLFFVHSSYLFLLSIGLYEGIRLSDGQKGWFPVANVLEITNEHVRRRNLRERYRVIQAAGVVAKIRTMP